MERAHSTEFDALTSQPLIIFMPEISQTEMGGTMRLGARNTLITTSYTSTSTVTQQYNAISTTTSSIIHSSNSDIDAAIHKDILAIGTKTLASQVYGFSSCRFYSYYIYSYYFSLSFLIE